MNPSLDQRQEWEEEWDKLVIRFPTPPKDRRIKMKEFISTLLSKERREAEERMVSAIKNEMSPCIAGCHLDAEDILKEAQTK